MATVRQTKNKLIKKVNTKEIQLDFFPVEVFDSFPKVFLVTEEDEGKKIWVASEPRTKTIRLFKYKPEYYEITYAGEKKYRTLYPQEVLIHPDEITKKRLEKFGYEIFDGRKS